MLGFEYVIKNGDAGVTISTAITILQVKAGAAALEILRATLTQSNGTSSVAARVSLLRKTVAATVTSFTPRKLNPAYPAALAVGGTAATGFTGTAEGTDGEVLVERGFNVLNGFEWVPTPDERLWVPQGGILAMKFPAAPASHTWHASFKIREFQ